MGHILSTRSRTAGWPGWRRHPLRPGTVEGEAESDWVPALCAARSLDLLPVIWDADFLHGDADGEAYVLCEINVSSVFPFPDETLQPLAAETRRRLLARSSRPSHQE